MSNSIDLEKVWINFQDAGAYCKWKKMRLPYEWEWQYASQGGDNTRLYPWGNTFNSECVPVPNTEREMRPADNVDAHNCPSPFGVFDLVGNVYQLINEFVDDHTRAAILRGGNYYQPQGSGWYLPQSYQLNQHTKFLLIGGGLDRSRGIGFRCAADSQ